MQLHADRFVPHQADQAAEQIHVLLAAGKWRKSQKNKLRRLVIQRFKIEAFRCDSDRTDEALHFVGTQMRKREPLADRRRSIALTLDQLARDRCSEDSVESFLLPTIAPDAG